MILLFPKFKYSLLGEKGYRNYTFIKDYPTKNISALLGLARFCQKHFRLFGVIKNRDPNPIPNPKTFTSIVSFFLIIKTFKKGTTETQTLYCFMIPSYHTQNLLLLGIEPKTYGSL